MRDANNECKKTKKNGVEFWFCAKVSLTKIVGLFSHCATGEKI